MFNDSLSRTRHIKFSRMSKFYKLENQHAITILQKEDRYITISNLKKNFAYDFLLEFKTWI